MNYIVIRTILRTGEIFVEAYRLHKVLPIFSVPIKYAGRSVVSYMDEPTFNHMYPGPHDWQEPGMRFTEWFEK